MDRNIRNEPSYIHLRAILADEPFQTNSGSRHSDSDPELLVNCGILSLMGDR